MDIITRNLLKVMLERASKEHIKHYPQLVCFSYDTISRKIFIDGVFEKKELEALKSFLIRETKNKGTCIDIGANIGNHSLFFSNIFEHVISFEPNLRTFKLLDINKDLSDNINAINIGIGSKVETLKAFVNPLSMGGARITSSNEANLEFKITTLDKYLSEETSLPDINFIKMDIEGHELEALKGATNTLKLHRPILALELHVKKDKDLSEAILKFLKEHGYKYAHVLSGNFIPLKKPHFSKVLIESFNKIADKNHKMVLFTYD